ncbi:MAG: thiolase family protein [Chloroflexi bacterium]|nr:thiolase family protein [Chloroflexota bacterium]
MAIEFAPGKRPCFIGVGYSPCHRYAPRSLGSIAYEAVTNAVADAGIELSQIDGISVYPNPLGVNRGIVGHDVIPATYMMRMLGLPNVRWFNQTNWSMIAVSVIEAANALATGACDYALVYRALHHPAGVRYHDNPATTAGGENQFTVPYGHGGGGPRQALHFQRYLEKYGAPRVALADAVLNAHKNAQLNENAAWYGREITRDDYLNARIISWPMSLFDYDMPVDGAGAVIMTTEDRARGTPHPGGYIAGYGMTPHNLERGGIIESLEDLYEMDGLHAENLYRSAGLGPEDVDVLHLYDGFSPMMWTRMETFRFCGEGEAPAWATAERLALDGEQPFNTSGGNLGEGRLHGMAHVAETARQMMGTAGPRQIAGAEVALCEVGPFAMGASFICTRE